MLIKSLFIESIPLSMGLSNGICQDLRHAYSSCLKKLLLMKYTRLLRDLGNCHNIFSVEQCIRRFVIKPKIVVIVALIFVITVLKT